MLSSICSQQRVQSGEQAIERGREAYRPIALRGAVCFDTVQHLREIHALYQLSFRQFLAIYDHSIAHSDRSVTSSNLRLVRSLAIPYCCFNSELL